jgi:hypothetical protein
MRWMSPQSHPRGTHCDSLPLQAAAESLKCQWVGVERDPFDQYASKIVELLAQGLHEVPDGIAVRLSQMRQLALTKKKVD